MVSDAPMCVMESAEELDPHVSSIHIGDEPNNEDVSSSVTVISVDGASDVSYPVPAGDEASESTAESAGDDEAVVSQAVTEHSATPVTTGLYDAALADEGTVNTSSTSEDAGSRNTWRKHLKRIRRVFSRMFRELCCCCLSVEVIE